MKDLLWTDLIYFYHLERLIFYLENNERPFMDRFDLKKHRVKKMQIFDQNHGLNPLRKLQIFPLLNSLAKAKFLSRTS